MPEFEPLPAPGKLAFKLVYYGPAQSGKTTNLIALHDQLAPSLKGELMTMETQGDRTLYFDLLPLGFRARSGLLIKLQLLAVLGQVQHDGTRKAVRARGESLLELARSAKALGLASLFGDACDKVNAGLTTAEEVMRVLGPGRQ